MRITMKFTKMQAFGNDYVYIDAIHQNITNLPELARFVSDRHYGTYSQSVLYGDCSNGCRSITTQRGDGLQVSLYAGSSAAIGSCYT